MVSIIIITKNQLPLLRQCLNEIRNTVRDIDYEVIVLANNSTKEVKQYLDFMKQKDSRIKVIYSIIDLGFSKANNMAVRQAQGDYVLLLNDDTIPTKDWLAQMLKLAEEKWAGIVGAKLIYPGTNRIQHAGVVFDEKKRPQHIYFRNDELDPRSCEDREYQAVTFACALIRRDVWEELEGLKQSEVDPECYYRYEDIDFCLRAGERGHRVWFCASAVVGHYAARTVASLNQKNPFKYLNEFLETWKDKIETDCNKYNEFPKNLPHILIGIPISEAYHWATDILLENLLKLRIYKGIISICFVVNNSGQRFLHKLLVWAKTSAKEAGFRDVIFPTKMIFENDKNKIVVMARNLIRRVAQQKNATHIYWWDCDVVIPPDTISKLLIKNEPISMATVWYKTEDKKPMVFKKRKLIFDDFDRFLATKDENELEELTTEHKSKIRALGPYYVAYECVNGKSKPEERIDAGGLGACLMRRDITDRFEFEERKKGFGTEDLLYFYKLNKAGYDVVLDTTIKTVHLAKGEAFYG